MKPQTKTTKPKRLVLIDAHAILHRAYHALPEFASRSGEPTGALYGLSAMLIKLIADLKPDYVIACYDMAGPTFRHEAYEGYKAKRPKAEGDLIRQMNRSRDIFKAFGIPIYEKEGFEADDVIGTVVKETEKERATGTLRVIIASGDMDTLQLVEGKDVIVYTLKKGISDTIEYDEAAVLARYGFSPRFVADYKGLRGDPSDNIIGVPGIGEKTATALIKEFGSIEEIYKKLKEDPAAFAAKGFKERIVNLLRDNEEEALFSKTLATIRLDAQIDFKMPQKSWREGFSPDTVKKLFAELDFRTLGARAEQLAPAPFLSSSERAAQNTMGGKVWGLAVDTAETENMADDITHNPRTEKAGDENLFRETVLAAWLLDSEKANPTHEEVLALAQAKTLSEAHANLSALLKERGLWNIFSEMELPLIPILLRAEKRGILIDTAYLEKLSLKLHKKLDVHAEKIWRHAGTRFNINSPQQLGHILFEHLKLSRKGVKKTGGGAISTRESELLKLKGQHAIIDELLAYRELQKLLSTYIDNLPAMVGEDGRLHTTFVQTGTATGRLSSQNPNVQNIPVKGEYGMEIRRAFVAAEGHVLAAFDYSQIELRVLAILSGDARLLQTFKEERDIHAAVASQVFGVPEEEVTKDMRRKAKVINFGIMYGMGVTSLEKALGGTREEAQIFYENYFKKFPKVTEFMEKVKRDAARLGYTETLFGRRRYIRGIRSPIPYIRAEAERQAFNAPIQGTAADIIKKAMLAVDVALARAKLSDKTHLLLQVHDELIYEIEKDAVPAALPLIKKEMEGVMNPPTFPKDIESREKNLYDAYPSTRHSRRVFEESGGMKEKIPFGVSEAHGENWGEI